MHRDLKPSNCLLRQDQSRDGYLQVCDFGLSTRINRYPKYLKCGTITYMSPEIVNPVRSRIEYGKECDWWAFGVSLYFMFQGKTPWYHVDDDEIQRQIRNPNIDYDMSKRSWHLVSSEAQDLISKLLDKDLSKRLKNGQDIRKHPWFKDFEWNKLASGTLPAPWCFNANGKLVNNPKYSGNDSLDLDGQAQKNWLNSMLVSEPKAPVRNVRRRQRTQSVRKSTL